MTQLAILTAPHPILKKRALAVTDVNDQVRQLMQDMLETMYEGEGIGLAANQVGALQRVMVLDLQNSPQDVERPAGFYPLFIANPEIIEASEELVEAEEGCLSLPDQSILVTRPYSVKLRYKDYNNKLQELDAEGWLARAIQHEIDHLNGKLLIDSLSYAKKSAALRKLAKLKKTS
ncbi:MAG: peptide deformylase [Rickettsiaceae bacterium]